MACPANTILVSWPIPRRHWQDAGLSLLVLVVFFTSATAATASSRNPIVVSAGAHALTVPWHLGPVVRRWNPVFVAGTERTLRPGKSLRLYYTMNLGVLRHYWWMTGVFLDAEFGISHRLPLRLRTDARLGLGYMHYFWRREILVLDHGVYSQATDWGNPSVLVPLTIMLGYRGSSARPLVVAPFLSAQWALQAPFSDEAPAMTHLLLTLGVRIYPGRSTQTMEK